MNPAHHHYWARICQFMRRHRAFTILGLGIATLSVSYLFVFLPRSNLAQESREVIERRITQLRADDDRLVADLRMIEDRGGLVGRLVDRGWLAGQDRLLAAERIELLGQRHHLARLDYQFQPEQRFEVGDSKLRGVSIVETVINLDVELALDIDFRAFLSDLRDMLPGTLEVTTLQLERVKPLGLPDLLALEAGEAISLLRGSTMLAWRTLEIEGVPSMPMRESFRHFQELADAQRGGGERNAGLIDGSREE